MREGAVWPQNGEKSSLFLRRGNNFLPSGISIREVPTEGSSGGSEESPIHSVMFLMRPLILASLIFTLLPTLQAKDSRNPTVKITDVDKGKAGGLSVLDFTIVAKDNVDVLRIEYRAAVDGKQSRWIKFPYYEGTDNRPPFRVDCDVFVLEVRAVDRSRNRSRVAKKSFSGLRG